MMRRRRKLATWTLALTTAVCALLEASCGTRADDCALNLTCAPEGTGGSGGGTPACVGDPTEDPAVVIDACGVFANAAAAPGGDGTKAKPFASLQEAIDKAGSGRVYACVAQGTAFAEAVTIASGVEVIGGFHCEAWTWSASARSAIEGPADRVTLTLTDNAGGAKVKGFAITAASATVPGGSSIGVAAADVEAELAQVDVMAGDGIDGENGATSMEAPVAGASAEEMSASNACVAPNVVIGGTAGVTMCEDGETRGGDGGTGGITGMDDGNGQAGRDGAPLPEPNPVGKGIGGSGQVDPEGECEPGEPGKSGAPGAAGSAGSRTTLTLTGISGGDGDQGMIGGRGQGGGGGGGARAGVFCSLGMTLVDGVGASGGGGGAGGCGGKGGGGGKAGGSSIGILNLGTRLALTEVTVTVGKAGKGGDGAPGKAGASGGSGAAGGEGSGLGDSRRGCQGGNGGDGGRGGFGGGGRGGHAVGIAFASTPAAAPELKAFTPGTPGAGGNAGPGGPPESNGAPGNAKSCWNFETSKSCEN
ncbi:hypothetical protein ACMHYB_53580 [Sorangium sp. So ce1128]